MLRHEKKQAEHGLLHYFHPAVGDWRQHYLSLRMTAYLHLYGSLSGGTSDSPTQISPINSCMSVDQLTVLLTQLWSPWQH